MLNNIYINNIKIQDVVPVQGIRKGFLLEDGSIFEGVSRQLPNAEVECNICHKRRKIKKLGHRKDGYLKQVYRCDSCRMTGEGNPFYGKKHSKEFKQKLSRERAGTWGVGSENAMHGRIPLDVWKEKYGEEKANELEAARRAKVSEKATGEGNAFYGKHHSEALKAKRALQSKETWANLSDEERESRTIKQKQGMREYTQEHADEYRQSKIKAAKASNLVQGIDRKMNRIETEVFDYLERVFPNSFKFSTILGFYQFDFGCKEARVLIEVHGDYWHCNPLLYLRPKNQTQEKNLKRDALKKQFADKHGFYLFIIWESDINKKDFSSLSKLNEIMITNNSQAKLEIKA